MKKLFILLCFKASLCCSQTNDYVSDLDFDKVNTNQLSVDFVVLEIYSNEVREHYQMCKEENLSLHSYDSIWDIDHAKLAKIKNPCRIAFLTSDNFHLMNFEYWDTESKEFIIGPYQPTLPEYDYFLGNGFAFNLSKELSDFNSDGYMDKKVEYTKLDYEYGHKMMQSVANEFYFEYKEKVREGKLNEKTTFEEYQEKHWKSRIHGIYGEGYITRYSKNGLLHFFTLEHPGTNQK